MYNTIICQKIWEGIPPGVEVALQGARQAPPQQQPRPPPRRRVRQPAIERRRQPLVAHAPQHRPGRSLHPCIALQRTQGRPLRLQDIAAPFLLTDTCVSTDRMSQVTTHQEVGKFVSPRT